MAEVTQYACDCCGKIVGGKDRAAVSKETYLFVNGFMAVSKHYPKFDERKQIFITPPSRQLTLCYTKECIMGYIAGKIEHQENFEKEKLQREANDNFTNSFNN